MTDVPNGQSDSNPPNRPAHWFPKGVSGNPGGRRKTQATVLAFVRDHSKEAVEMLISIMRNSPHDSQRLAACRELLDRAWGKPKEFVEANVNVGRRREIDLSQLDDKHLEALDAAIRALVPLEQEIIEGEATEVEGP